MEVVVVGRMLFGWDGTALAQDRMIVEILKRVRNILRFLSNDFEPTRGFTPYYAPPYLPRPLGKISRVLRNIFA